MTSTFHKKRRKKYAKRMMDQMVWNCCLWTLKGLEWTS